MNGRNKPETKAPAAAGDTHPHRRRPHLPPVSGRAVPQRLMPPVPKRRTAAIIADRPVPRTNGAASIDHASWGGQASQPDFVSTSVSTVTFTNNQPIGRAANHSSGFLSGEEITTTTVR
ncbi:hypothetical protein Axi01nite_79340 [Actinoplanes xinjiangensis]|nr:hypothetical protein Axi01nite_79340 [Actinoplanes xinjiangensis]